jgi:hypothetical protein
MANSLTTRRTAMLTTIKGLIGVAITSVAGTAIARDEMSQIDAFLEGAKRNPREFASLFRRLAVLFDRPTLSEQDIATVLKASGITSPPVSDLKLKAPWRQALGHTLVAAGQSLLRAT